VKCTGLPMLKGRAVWGARGQVMGKACVWHTGSRPLPVLVPGSGRTAVRLLGAGSRRN
jgi:hypothetical protein